MNVTQLRAFVSVVDLGSFSEAARQSGISQPAVTMQIKALEGDVGATLLDRRYHRVELTEAGEALLPYARSVLAELVRAREDISALSDTITGRLTIAASTTPGDYVIPRVLGDFLKLHPQVQVEISVQDTAEAVAAVAGGRADFGVCGAIDTLAKAEFEELGCDELYVICSPSSPLAGRKAVPFAELAEADWVTREPGSGTGQVARAALEQHGVDPDELRVLVELGSGEAIVNAVEGGLGIAMVSHYVADKALAQGSICRVDVAAPAVTRSFFAVMPKVTQTRAAIAFHAHLRHAIECETALSADYAAK
ncbi:MAG: LysR family transcriptional regulator [Coriobacteriia bacterium]|nr:LysR family transcriptional regulator [Coriobacteriia bacterium]